jgi:hypothetical protein
LRNYATIEEVARSIPGELYGKFKCPAARRADISACYSREDYIKIDRQEFGWGALDWMYVAQGRDKWQALVNAVMNLQVT